MLKTILGRLQFIGAIEAISFLVLVCIGVPLKWFGGMPAIVQIVGPIHGVLWIFYLAAIFQARLMLKWSMGRVLRGVAASVLPFGPFVFDYWLRREALRET